MADINTLFELVKELHRGGVVVKAKNSKQVFTSPRLRTVKRSLLLSALMRHLIVPIESFALTMPASSWLEEEKKKRRRKAARAL
jgi:hypothetical protein